MIKIIPNWHPVLVHFTVALIVASALFVIAAYLFKGRKRSDAFHAAAAWSLWLGAAVTVLTLAAGLNAYETVAHDTRSHIAMTDHRNWAFVTAGLIWLAALWSFRTARGGYRIGRGPTLLLFLAATMVGVTAFKGGDLVYRFGLGVQSLPAPQSGKASEGTGDGHDHDHGSEPGSETRSEPGQDKTAEPSDENGDDANHEHADGADHDGTDAPALASAPASGNLDPAQTADAFHGALVAGDHDTVTRLLAEDVVILEAGHAQKSRAEYMSGHMISDMKFLAGIDREVLDRSASEAGDLAWVITHTRMTGVWNDNQVDFLSREMLVMRRDGGNWQITLIHWGDK